MLNNLVDGVYLAIDVTDLRKSIYGLVILVTKTLILIYLQEVYLFL